MVYTDSSKNQPGQVGKGSVTYRGLAHALLRGTILLGQTAEVFHGEVAAATSRLQTAIEHPFVRNIRQITVSLDNEQAARRPTRTAAQALHDFPAMCQQWVTSLGPPGHQRFNTTKPIQAKVLCRAFQYRRQRRCRQHEKEACRLPCSSTKMTLGQALLQVDEQFYQERAQWWHTETHTTYRQLGLNMPKGAPPELCPTRCHLAHTLAARSQHENFARYHRMWNHEGTLFTCFCWNEREAQRIPSTAALAERKRGQTALRRELATHRMHSTGSCAPRGVTRHDAQYQHPLLRSNAVTTSPSELRISRSSTQRLSSSSMASCSSPSIARKLPPPPPAQGTSAHSQQLSR